MATNFPVSDQTRRVAEAQAHLMREVVTLTLAYLDAHQDGCTNTQVRRYVLDHVASDVWRDADIPEYDSAKFVDYVVRLNRKTW